MGDLCFFSFQYPARHDDHLRHERMPPPPSLYIPNRLPQSRPPPSPPLPQLRLPNPHHPYILYTNACPNQANKRNIYQLVNPSVAQSHVESSQVLHSKRATHDTTKQAAACERSARTKKSRWHCASNPRRSDATHATPRRHTHCAASPEDRQCKGSSPPPPTHHHHLHMFKLRK